ncbi:hypothetical protein EDB83DRAFT_1887117 [Lactarius deliciosus]|nr:hypothetical protein EDB83DRAFT_1887117 [Lactarius deliciosus]
MATPHDSRDLEARTEAQRRWFSKQATVYSNDEGSTQAREKRQGEAEEAEYGDSSATYWNLYASETEISDQKLVETLTGDTNSLLFLNSIFSAIIAAFIIETYKALQPNNNQETVCLLSQLVSQENSSQQPSRFCPSPYPGGPSAAVIRSNILLVISFFLAMMSALACTFIQLWCREYTKYASPRAAPHKRGRVRTYLFQGLERFELRRLMYGVHVLLHTSVFLFFCGVSDYLHDAYPRVGMISWCCVATLGGGVFSPQHFPPDHRQLPVPNGSDPTTSVRLQVAILPWSRYMVVLMGWHKRSSSRAQRPPLQQKPFSCGRGE